MREEILRMERVTYKENEVVLLEDFNLQVCQGEIMALLSINSHGLSAFLKLLQVNAPLYDGYIYFGGEQVNSWKSSRRANNRISIIQAKSSLIERMSVTDNIFVMRQGFRQEIIRTKLLDSQLVPFLKDIGMDIPQETYVEKLSVFERMVVELLRAVVAGYRLIVLNDIGTLISYEEAKRFCEILRHYARKGFSFLYICSHFEEAVEFCDCAALFSEGRILKVILKEEMQDEMMRLYTGEFDRLVRGHMENRKEYVEKKEKIFALSGENQPDMTGISFEVYAGECLMLQILAHNAMQAMIRLLTDENGLPHGCCAVLDEKPLLSLRDSRIAVIQELPTKSMVFPELDYMDNLCISLEKRLSRSRRIRESIRMEYGEMLGREVFSMPVEALSEKQKYQLVYTRVLLQKPRVVFCINPFKGADLSHRIFIWKMLETLLEKNMAVILVSVNLSDALTLADRLMVINNDGSRTEIIRKDFSGITMQVPWIHLYKR